MQEQSRFLARRLAEPSLELIDFYVKYEGMSKSKARSKVFYHCGANAQDASLPGIRGEADTCMAVALNTYYGIEVFPSKEVFISMANKLNSSSVSLF
jgi:hypothetical protein